MLEINRCDESTNSDAGVDTNHSWSPPEPGKYQITQTNIGVGRVWANREFCWTSVPKNANMRFRHIMRELHIPETTYSLDVGTLYNVFVIRDPVTRLLSGLGEYQQRSGQRKSVEFWTLMERLLHTPERFDEHVEPQAAFVAGKTYTDIFRFENLIESLCQHSYFAAHHRVIHKHLTQSKLQQSKHHVGQDLNRLYRDHRNLVDSVIKKYYNIDMEIWQDPQGWLNRRI